MFFDRIVSELARTKALAPFYTKRRPLTLRTFGHLLHPAAVTDAWYAADCPPVSKRLPGVSTVDHMRWRVACACRGTKKAGA